MKIINHVKTITGTTYRLGFRHKIMNLNANEFMNGYVIYRRMLCDFSGEHSDYPNYDNEKYITLKRKVDDIVYHSNILSSRIFTVIKLHSMYCSRDMIQNNNMQIYLNQSTINQTAITHPYPISLLFK